MAEFIAELAVTIEAPEQAVAEQMAAELAGIISDSTGNEVVSAEVGAVAPAGGEEMVPEAMPAEEAPAPTMVQNPGPMPQG